jgi:hypothetical protein
MFNFNFKKEIKMINIKGKAQSAWKNATNTLTGRNGGGAQALAVSSGTYGAGAGVLAGMAIGFSAPAVFIMAGGLLVSSGLSAAISHMQAKAARKAAAQASTL